MKKTPLPNDLATITQARLKESLDTFPASLLPSISQLAQQMGVSYQTMRNAVHMLINQGLLAFGPGKRIYLSSCQCATQSAATKFSKAVRSRIGEGIYKSGDRLPKIRCLMLEEHISTAIISDAFLELSQENLIHKKGKFWYAGPRKEENKTRKAGSFLAHTSPVIITVAPNTATWNLLFSGDHLIPFSSALHGELLAYGMQLLLALNTKSNETDSMVVATGLNSVVALIKSLGNRYRGTLLLHSESEVAAWPEWVDELLRFGQPVAYFNYGSDADKIYNKAMHRKLPFYRFFLDEAAAITLALDHLVKLGHTIIGVPVYDAIGFTWPKQRFALINYIAKRSHPAITIVGSLHTESFWNFEKYSSLTDLDQFVKPGLTSLHSDFSVQQSITLRDKLLQQTPSLLSLIKEKGATALFGLNDRFARSYYFWCKAVGIKIPHDLSIISCDNLLDAAAIPISTIDFGFARLGYLAAHAFIGDIPVESGTGGRNIAGECTLIDRGSLGPAPAKKRPLL